VKRFKRPTAWEVFWLATLGPFFLLGWAVLHSTKHLNRLAGLWCRVLLSVYPKD
jgi:hypothetical protein